ncbi:hypothetical protein GCM10011611_27550 [Aliidongia dinghuensis]|uniref:Uncharacterized protein n=1 Tax=Aliidongia dinghuensis TaxID=1867774 RepID=A0A8J2YTL7_9PROT|nr:hypothetical protein [Aliidongia dinghuensis]GGF20030.1 hypothetical protein GCM10011611_27550 [Aliidongia dinghuensis]
MHPLAEDQLDGITAAGLTLVPRASAIAFGANAVASEAIEARTAEGQVLKVRWAKPVRGIEWAADVETFNGVIGLAHAGASASGSGGADCNAQIEVQADYVQSLNSKTTTGTIAICNCTALGIALLK